MGRHVRRRRNRVRGTLALTVAVCALTTSQPALHDTAALAGTAGRGSDLAPPRAVLNATGRESAGAAQATVPVAAGGALSDNRVRGDDGMPGGTARSVRVSSPKGTRTWTASALSDHGIPAAAVRAYRHAAARLRASDPTCGLPWTLLAGIGRVESDHGRYGGATLGRNGVSHPRIIGMRLDGTGPVAAIRDTDRGRLDGDRVWDRAVGPMQFIPATWEGAGSDGDRDGTASPHDLDDAALAAATYLCAGSGSLVGEAARAAAVYRYNQDDYYVALVLAFADGYRTGVFTLPPPPADEAPGQVRRQHDAKPRVHEARGNRVRREHGHPDRVRHAPAGKGHGAAHGAGPVGTAPGSKPGHAPRKPERSPKKPAKPGDEPAKPSKKPAVELTTVPAPTEPPAPVLTALSGQFAACASPAGWCLGETHIDLGQPAVNSSASADFDADGSTETLAEEFDGLVAAGTTDLLVEMGDGGAAVVYVINGHDYRNADGTLA